MSKRSRRTRRRRLRESATQARSKRRKVQLREKVVAGPDSRIDREAGIIHDVKVLGKESDNGRVYEESTFAQAVAMYEGVVCRIDHDMDVPVRPLASTVGQLRNVVRKGDDIRADFHVVMSHPMSAQIFEMAEKFPGTFGFSHAADGFVEDDGHGIQRVVELIHVESVDLVTKPATTKSLFEGKEAEMPKPKQEKTTLRTLVEQAPNSTPGKARLAEMAGDPIFDEEVEVDPAQTPEMDLSDALRGAIVAILGDASLDVPAKLAKIEQLLNMEAEANPEETVEAEGETTDEAPAQVPEEELSDVPDNVNKPALAQDKIAEAAIAPLRKQIADVAKSVKVLAEAQQKSQTAQERHREEAVVAELFEAAELKPTSAQRRICLSLSGKDRATYVQECRELHESREYSEPRSSGGVGPDEKVDAFPKTSEAFVAALR